MTARRADREGLRSILRRALEARPEVAFAYLHGSFVGDGSYRDVDVAMWLDPRELERVPPWRYALDLGVALGIEAGTLVDVQVLNAAPLGLRYHALRGEPLLVRDGELLDAVRERTWDAYFDFQPLARRYLREALDA
jgi:hypothetical protein